MLDAATITSLLELQPLDVEGGVFRRTWASAETLDDGRPTGTAIYAMFTDEPGSFSAIHRLDTDEVWHHYVGDPLVVHLFGVDREHRTVALGGDLVAGERPQLVIPANTWMGAHVVDGGRFSLIGCTMAPGFTGDSYEGGVRADLIARYPDDAEAITRLTRPGLEIGRPNEA